MFTIQLVSIIIMLVLCFLVPVILLYLLLKRFGLSYPKQRTISIVIVVFAYFVYRSYNPSDSIFIEDFKKNTSFQFPETGDFKNKEEASIDFHGSYWNLAIVEVSTTDYNNLLLQTQTSEQFTPDTEFNIIGDLNIENYSQVKDYISFTKGKVGDSYTIGFSTDKKTIYLQRLDM